MPEVERENIETRMTGQRLREIADRLAMRCLPCDMPYAVQEAAELRAHADQLERNAESKRHLDAIAEALYPGKPKFEEERWTYLPDQLPGMVRELQAQNEQWWDQHSVQCGNCSVEIVTRKGSAPDNNGLSDAGGSEDELLCGRCAGAQMYDYADQVAALTEQLARWKKAIEGLTPSGSEFVNDPEACAAHIRDRYNPLHTFKQLREQLAAARVDGERLATLRRLSRLMVDHISGVDQRYGLQELRGYLETELIDQARANTKKPKIACPAEGCVFNAFGELPVSAPNATPGSCLCHIQGKGPYGMSWFRKPMEEGIREGVTQGLSEVLPGLFSGVIKEAFQPVFDEIHALRKENESLRRMACIRHRGYCQCEACKARANADREGKS